MSTILVTGAAKGLGKAIYEALEKENHEVIGYDRNYGQDVLEPKLACEKLDVLINCAGINLIDWLEDFTDEAWDQVINVNAKGIFKMVQAYLPMLKEL